MTVIGLTAYYVSHYVLVVTIATAVFWIGCKKLNEIL